MKIDYTYKEVEQPIEKAEWCASSYGSCCLTIYNRENLVELYNHNKFATYNLEDFRDYVALMNRVLKQMEAES